MIQNKKSEDYLAFLVKVHKKIKPCKLDRKDKDRIQDNCNKCFKANNRCLENLL